MTKNGAGSRGRALLRWAVRLGVLGVLVVGGYLLWERIQRPPAVAVVAVVQEDIERILAVTGRVRPRLVNRVQPVVSGRLLEAPLDDGDRFTMGQVMARIDDVQPEAARQRADASLRESVERMVQARRELERAERLAGEGIVSTEVLEQAQLAVDAGRQEVEQRRQTLREQQSRREDYVLRAPYDGVILERLVDPGQGVTAGTAIYEIASTEELWIEAEVDELYLDQVRVGMDARVAPLSSMLSSTGGRGAAARVVSIAPEVDEESGAATVRLAWIKPLEPDQQPPTGLSMDVNLEIARHPEALTLPRSAIHRVSGWGASRLPTEAGDEGFDGPWVLVLEAAEAADSADGRRPRSGDEGDEGFVLRRRPVAFIDWPAPRVVITSGLQTGELVAEDPEAAAPGTTVRRRDAS